MGINGLLPFIDKAINKTGHLNDFKGKTVAVDAYVWIYRGSIKCAKELALKKEPRDYVEYCHRQISLLTQKGITPLLVFDGCYLPSKEYTEAKRKERRAEKRREGIKSLISLAAGLALSKKKPAAYDKHFKASVEVTPQMAYNVIIECCVERGIEYVVAPYEADAQLAYLLKVKKVDAILTEDSDLICFGCHTIIYKLQHTGHCHIFRQKNLFKQQKRK